MNILEFKKIFSAVDFSNFIGIFLLLVLCVLFEFLSISLLIPVIYLILEPQNISNIPFFQIISKFFDFNINKLNINKIIYSFFLIFIFKNLILIYFNKLISKFSEFLRLDISSKLFNYYTNLPYEEFIKKNSVIMLRNITDEVIHLSNFFICLLNLFVEALIFLTILVVLFYFNFKVTFISTVIILCLSLVLYLLFSQKLKIWGENRRNYTGKFMKTSIQTFNSIKEVKTLNKESYFFKYYYKQLQKAVEATYLHRIVNLLPRYIFEIVTIVMFFLLFVLGALDHSKNNFIILIGVYGYSLYRLLPAANKILINISNIKFTAPSVHNIINEFDLVNNKKIIKEVLNKKKNELDIKNFQSLSLKNLSFSYEKNKNLLKNINFEISKNEIVGIYGESGSGKTTLVNILMGLFNPTSGKIIYNKNIEFNSNLHFTPKTIGCVFQPVNLWDDTIKKI